MRTEVIKAGTIEAAAERILDELKEDTNATVRQSSRNNIIYFDGWDGLGSSAVLRAVALKAPAVGLEFIHIDCSKWKSKRELQRVIAGKLKLPTEVMDLFDIQDEDDDFNGVAQDSRAEIPEVVDAIYQHTLTLSSWLLVILQNGSCDEVDLTTMGLPVSRYTRIKVLWTFQGSLRVYPRIKVDKVLESTRLTDVFFSATCHEQVPSESWWEYLVRQVAAEVARRNVGRIIIDQPELVSECFTYVLKLCCMGRQSNTVLCDMATHLGNCMVCDGIIQASQQGEEDVLGAADHLWQAADALQREMQLIVDYYYNNQQYPHLVKYAEVIPCWSSPTYRVTQILDGGILNRDIFRAFSKLCILILSRCKFSFSSPAFLCCNNLRFLLLSHCQDQAIISADGADRKEEEKIIDQCFRSLWVLDVRYTHCDWLLSAQMLGLMTQLRELIVMGAQDWDVSQLQGRVPNIRKLRIQKSTLKCSSKTDDLFSGMKKMELLDFSGNNIMSSGMKSLNIEADGSLVETIIIDEGCVGLEEVSFRGCAHLKSVLLRGLFEELRRIDISGTAVKTLDLSATSVQDLDELVALGCDNFRAILWPSEKNRKKYLSKVRIVPSGKLPVSSLTARYGSREPTEYEWYLSVSDARLLRSLVPLKQYFNDHDVDVEISSVGLVECGGDKEENRITKSIVGIRSVSVFADTFVPQASDDGDGRPIRTKTCYLYIQDEQGMRRTRLRGERGEVISTTSTSRSITVVPDMICHNARMLHVHDSKSITCVPGPLEGSTWRYLRWCRVERCPGLDCVFVYPRAVGSTDDDIIIFYFLHTLWCSQLPRVRRIWNFNGLSSAQRFSTSSFEDLDFMHVDLCPRLTHVLPLSAGGLINSSFRLLKTLEIVWCGDLRAVFPFDNAEVDQSREEDDQEEATTTVTFPRLKRMHLHELPKLLGICGHRRIYAPNLESIKVRGCWSLTRLPAVGGGDYNKVKCDCEKEWWNKLKWDGRHNHHHYLYEPMHPRHNKEILLRRSVLR